MYNSNNPNSKYDAWYGENVARQSREYQSELTEYRSLGTPAELVKVVRCGECKHHDDCICVVCEEGNTVVCMRRGWHVNKTDFCSYGERRCGDAE